MRTLASLVTAAGIALAAGAAASAAPEVPITDGSLVLAQVSHALSPDQLAAGRLAPGHDVRDLAETIRRRGFTDDQIARGRVIVVREGVYWNNTSSGIRHDMLFTALLPEGMRVEAGDVVEETVGRPVTIARVRAHAGDEQCFLREVPGSVLKGLLGAISLVGASGAATWYCKGIEPEGWVQYGRYWHKPVAVQQAAAAPASTAASTAVGAADKPRDGGARADDAQAPAPLPAPASVFKDCAACPEMVVVPAGSFEMGAAANESELSDGEGPRHRVEVSSFALGRTHVTRGQFAAFVAATGYDAGDSCRTSETGQWRNQPLRSWRSPAYAQNDSHPVTCIGWDDAVAYAQWLTRTTGRAYRLPTEAEWEYAARAGSTSARFWGDAPGDACGYANVADSALRADVSSKFERHRCTDGHAYTAPAGSFRPNAFGLHDMLGNLWQWTEDGWHPSYLGAPTDGSAWRGGPADVHPVRGSSWLGDPKYTRAAARVGAYGKYRSNDTGLRVAASLP